MMEQIVYDPRGQLITGNAHGLRDPARRRRADRDRSRRCTRPRRAIRWAPRASGEAGCIAIPPAIVNAAVDALAPFGVTHVDMPLTLRSSGGRCGRAP